MGRTRPGWGAKNRRCRNFPASLEFSNWRPEIASLSIDRQMKFPRHAWITLLAIGSAYAQEPPSEGPAPGSGKPPGERRPDDGRRDGRDRRGADWMAKMWKEADTDGDGFLSAAEFAAMKRPGQLPEEKRKEIFARLDKDHDGRIGPDELPRKRPGKMPPIEHVDADKDGRIVFGEFRNLGFVARLPEEKQRELFKRMDHDNDGALTPKDREHGRPPRDGNRDRGFRPDEMIKSLDTNGDGALNFDEFRKSPFIKGKDEDEQEDRFEQMDRNGDQKIDATDFKKPGPGDRKEPRKGG